MNPTHPEGTVTDVKASVKQKYGQAAQRVIEGNTDASCCGSSACCGSTSEAWDPITADLYEEGQKAGIPAEALLASLGCGNPTALAQLEEGEIVLDLGSGGGIDVLLSAKRVGPSGKVYGLDMTDEMLALANENKQRAGAENVEFLKGEIENIPLPDNSVDVIISNCVINLSADKARVLHEAFRVLKPATAPLLSGPRPPFRHSPTRPGRSLFMPSMRINRRAGRPRFPIFVPPSSRTRLRCGPSRPVPGR